MESKKKASEAQLNTLEQTNALTINLNKPRLVPYDCHVWAKLDVSLTYNLGSKAFILVVILIHRRCYLFKQFEASRFLA